jgi:hypothetical protein
LERKVKDLVDKFNEANPNSIPISFPNETWDAEEKFNEEELQKIEAYLRRRERIDEIHDEANNTRIARCERKMAEVGKDEFMNLIHGWGGESGKELWSDSEGMTEIEKEYLRLRNEEFLEDWQREHGKPYDMKDDPNAKF